MKPNHKVCEDHFRDLDIIRTDVVKLANGEVFISPRSCCKLKKGAIPLPYVIAHEIMV